MRRTISDDASLSTDIKSDISFVRRQKELRNLYRDFRSAIDNVQSVSSSKMNSINAQEEEEEDVIDDYENENSTVSENEYEEEEEMEDYQSHSSSPKKNQGKKNDTPNDIELIIQDIEMLQSETKEITDLLSKSKISKNPRVKTIKAQLQYVKHIIEGLRERAYGLKTKRLTL